MSRSRPSGLAHARRHGLRPPTTPSSVPRAPARTANYLPPYRLPLYELLSERFGVEVLCFGGEGSYVPEALRDLDAQIERARFPARRLRSQREAFRAGADHELVIAGVTGRVALPAAYLGARRRGRPFVLWASLWRHPRTLAHLASRPLMRRIYRDADAIVTYGEHVSAYVAARRGSRDGVEAAPQAVEPELFGRAVEPAEVAAWRRAAGLPADGAIVLFAGRLEAAKGVEPLLGAWRALARPDAFLCLAGDGPLAARVNGAAGNVRLLGRVDRTELPVAYAAADVVAVPSIATARFLEPWGLVCNEAMHQGRAVIASDAVGAAAGGLVRDGDTGVVVPAGDERALAAAIDRLLGDRELRERLGARARAAVREFSYERAADAFGRALEHARRRGGRGAGTDTLDSR